MMGDGAIKFITDSIVGGVVHDGNVWSSGTGESSSRFAKPLRTVGCFGNASVR